MIFKITIDAYDLRIVKYLYDLNKEETVTTYHIAKKLFPEIVSDYSLRSKDCFVRTRLDRLAEMGVIKINRESKKAYYFIVESNCIFKRLKINNTTQSSVFLKIHNGWCALPFDEFAK